MRVLVDTGTMDCRNMGDVAMLQVAVSRLAMRLPRARIHVFTDDAAALARQCPAVLPVPHRGCALWSAEDALLGSLQRVLPAWAWRLVEKAQVRVRRHWPSGYSVMLRARERLRGRDASPVATFVNAVRNADLLVVCGQATVSDAGGDVHARMLIDTIEVAVKAGVRVAMMGQGIGPVSDKSLLARARDVLPHVELIAVREARRGLPLLLAAGVPKDRIVMTGDDAVAPAYAMRPERLGHALGVHLRIAPLTAQGAGLAVVRSALRAAAETYRAPLIPLPISQHTVGANDAATIRQLLAGLDDASDGGASLDTPRKVMAAAGRCRVVVTGAYHAAVFALAQGIPVVCLSASDYYLHKFEGLADQFGDACAVVHLADAALGPALGAAIARAWAGADAWRASLLEVARGQIALGEAAYDRLAAAVGGWNGDGRRAGSAAGPIDIRPVGSAV